MNSKIFTDEVVENKQRKFGSQTKYYPCRIEFEDGTVDNCLFTYNQLQIARKRADKNTEDIPKKTLLENIFG